MKVAFIGLGIMGSRMAANLRAAGHQLTVYNRTQKKADTLLANGAVWADSPAAAVEDAAVVFTMLAHPEAVEAVALGEAGFLDAMTLDTLWVDSSTLNPSVSKRLASAAAATGVRFLDAPVAGSKPQAETGQLVFFVGGDEADVETANPLFQAMGSKVVHVGEHGMGTSLKMVVNHLLASSMVGFAEGTRLGEALGLPRSLLFDVLISGPVVPPYLTGKRAKLEAGGFEAEFPLKWMHKDLQMVKSAAGDVNLPTPLADVVQARYQEAVRLGWGEADFSGLYGYLQEKDLEDG